jgi:beta-glucosidase
MNLSSSQEALANAVLRLSKPTLLVLTNGGAISLDGLTEGANAIVEAFDPAHNTRQLASLLFGHANNWGKLPVTIYSHNYTTGEGDLPAQSMQNYDMVKSPGRTYRYYQGTPMFAFGHGLSLTTFSHACTCHTTDATVACSCVVKNTGLLAGDEVVFVFDALSSAIRAAVGTSHAVPFKRLVDFERVSLAAGATATLRFDIPKNRLSLTTASGHKKLYLGPHNLIFSRGNGPDVSVAVHV